MLKVVIVEDELNGLNNLKIFLVKYCDNIEFVGEVWMIEEG